MDCAECKQNVSRPERARWGCGYLPPAERVGVFMHGTFPADIEHAICPGWLISLPQAHETARAYGWRAQLTQFYDDQAPTPVLMDAIDVFAHELESRKAADFEALGKGG